MLLKVLVTNLKALRQSKDVNLTATIFKGDEFLAEEFTHTVFTSSLQLFEQGEETEEHIKRLFTELIDLSWGNQP